MTILKFAIAKYYVNVSNKEPFYEVITCIYTVRRDHIYHMDFGFIGFDHQRSYMLSSYITQRMIFCPLYNSNEII